MIKETLSMNAEWSIKFPRRQKLLDLIMGCIVRVPAAGSQNG